MSLKIIVAGEAGSGKSTLAEMLESILSELGFDTVLFDQDAPTSPLEDRVRALDSRRREGGTRIVIETRQTRRLSPDEINEGQPVV